MPRLTKEVGVPVEETPLTVARTTGGNDIKEASFNCASRLPLSAGVHGLATIHEEIMDDDVTNTDQSSFTTSQSQQQAVLMLEHWDFVVDITVLDALRPYPDAYRRVSMDCETSNLGLLPLSRMDGIFLDKGVPRPPVVVSKSGSAYQLIDGRHRFARCVILGLPIPAIVMNDGAQQYIISGGESNPGPDLDVEAALVKPVVKPRKPQVKPRRLYREEVRKSSVPQDQISSTNSEDPVSTSAPISHTGTDLSVRRTRGKRNYGNRKNNKKGYRGGDRHSRIELDIPMVVPEEFTSCYLAKCLSGKLPTRQELELKFRAAKLDLVYDCPCGKKNYGFPKACGCALKDQVLAMYNNMTARELQILLAEEPNKSIGDVILEQGKVADEIKSVESAIRNEMIVKETKEVPVKTAAKKEPDVVIVRKRRGLYRILKTPGVFNFSDKFNHHHQSISKCKDQSGNNMTVIPDTMINDELYAYLRRNEFEVYPDRAAKLSHMTKLAAKWDMGGFKLSAQAKGLDALALNKYFVTIQKVTDAKDTEFLLQEVKAYHTNSRFKRFLGKLGCYPKYLN